MVPVLSRSREFSLFLDGTGTGKKWSRKKVPVPVPEKIGPEKKSRSRYRKKFCPAEIFPSQVIVSLLPCFLRVMQKYYFLEKYSPLLCIRTFKF